MRSFPLEIMTLDGSPFSGEAEALTVRTTEGDVEILAGHIDYIAAVGTGVCRLAAGGNVRMAALSGGFLTVKGGEVRLVATTFEFADEIDINRAKAAKERAEQILRDRKSDQNIAVAERKLSRALSRLNAAQYIMKH